MIMVLDVVVVIVMMVALVVMVVVVVILVRWLWYYLNSHASSASLVVRGNGVSALVADGTQQVKESRHQLADSSH
jgi:hypothetical protein